MFYGTRDAFYWNTTYYDASFIGRKAKDCKHIGCFIVVDKRANTRKRQIIKAIMNGHVKGVVRKNATT